MEAVLEAFAAERLLTLAAGTVEISHEALLTAWPLLRDTWLADTHADRIVRTRLHNTAADWDRSSRDPSYLYTGNLLQAATETAARIDADPARNPPLSQVDRRFLHASTRAHRRKARRRQGLLAFLMALVVGLTAVAGWAILATRDATHQRDVAVSRQLDVEIERLGDTNITASALDSIAAWGLDHSSAEARYLMRTTAASPQIATLTSGHGAVNSVAFSPDGKTLATGDDDWRSPALGRGGRPADRPLHGGKTVLGGVQPGRQDPGHRFGPAVGCSNRTPDRQAFLQLVTLDGVQPGRQDPGNRRRERLGPALGHSNRPADRAHSQGRRPL